MIKSYSEMTRYSTFEDRYSYLKLDGIVGKDTFGHDRYLNQLLYKSPKWRSTRDLVILRDNGCDLGVEGYEIYVELLVHHINPLTLEQIENDDPCIYDLENLVTTTFRTHRAIHFGVVDLFIFPEDREPDDTLLW